MDATAPWRRLQQHDPVGDPSRNLQPCPQLSPIAQRIIADETIHWWFGEHAVAAAIHAQRGVDQGCPFSPALFATLIAGALERVRAGLRLLDESAAVLSYLDDIYIVVSLSTRGAP